MKHTAIAFALILAASSLAWGKEYDVPLQVTTSEMSRHGLHEKMEVTATDPSGTTYTLIPDNRKDVILPGGYMGQIRRRDILICQPKSNGNCRSIKMHVVHASQTKK